MKDLYLENDDEGVVEFIAGSMVPLFPFEKINGGLVIKLYDQEGVLQNMLVKDTKENELFGVWLRRFDRY